jgi:hypothetical protein
MTLAEAIDVLLVAHPTDEAVPADLSVVSASDYVEAWRVLRLDRARRLSTAKGEVIDLIDALKGLPE